MRKVAPAFIILLVITAGICSPPNSSRADTSIQTFWAKFAAAVSKGDKEAVASMSQFPIEMPYRVRSVKTKAELFKRFREVFSFDQTNAAKCFAKSKPELDGKTRFTVGCGEFIVYGFTLTKAGWKFKMLDDVAE
jgi:hypothetical protein